MKTAVKSFSIPEDDLAWIVRESTRTGKSQSQIVSDSINGTRTGASGTFVQDVNWIIKHKLTRFICSQIPTVDFDFRFDVLDMGFNSISLVGSSSSLEQLFELMARCILLRDKTREPVIFVVPYKLDPEHDVWKSLRAQEKIHVCTPDAMPRILKSAMKEKPAEED